MTPRIYVDPELLAANKDRVVLNAEDSHYLIQVLRLKVGSLVQLFDGNGNRFSATLNREDKRKAELATIQSIGAMPASKLRVTLIQGIARGDRMDWLIEKSCELGVSKIIPVNSSQSTVKLNDERAKKRQVHWRRVAVSACAQCGQDTVPQITGAMTLSAAIELVGSAPTNHYFVCLHPESDRSLSAWAKESLGPADQRGLTLVVGPESGLAALELDELAGAGAIRLSLGPRVLRTETAGVAALSVLQSIVGDLQ